MNKATSTTEYKPFLKMNLQHFADGGDGGTPEGGTPEGGKPEGQNPTDNHKQPPTENMIPKSRFDEVNNKFKEVQKQLDALLKEKEQAEIESKKQQGKFEELYQTTLKERDTLKGEYETFSQRVQTLEGVINELVEAKLADVPEEFHDLIPSNLTPEQKLSWLANAEKKGLFGSSKKDTPVGGQTNPSSKQTVDLSQMSAMELLKAGYGQK